METYWIAVVGVAGLLLGFAVAWLITGALGRAKVAEAKADAERWRAEVETARLETANVRAEAETIRANFAEMKATAAAAQAQRDAALARVQDAAKDREAAENRFRVLSAEILQTQSKQVEASATERLKQTEAVLAPVKENLGRLQDELAKVQQQRAALDADLKAQVFTVKTASDQLQAETKALATALSKPQVRGAWGESQLKNVFEAAGMREHVDFSQQFTSVNAAEDRVRPDARVELGTGRFVFVDAKVPMQAFLDALEKPVGPERDAELRRVSKHVRAHIDGLSSKNYFTADSGTPEFVVLFIPHEAMAAEALYHDPPLYEYAFKKNVVLATPTTLIAMLKTIGYSWQQHELAENAQRIAALGAELYKRTGTMTEAFAGLGRNIRQTVDAYNKTVGSFEGRLLPAARQMSGLGVAGGALPEIAPVTVEPRDPRRAEIVAGAVTAPLRLAGSDQSDQQEHPNG